MTVETRRDGHVAMVTFARPPHNFADLALLMALTGRRIRGEEAERWGLVDVLVPASELDAVALALAQEIAAGAPLAVKSTRKTMRGDLHALVAAQTDNELAEQAWLQRTADFAEGVRAVAERRPGRFQGE